MLFCARCSSRAQKFVSLGYREVAGDDESEEEFEEGMSMDVNAAPALSM